MRDLLLITIPTTVASFLAFLFARKEYKVKIKQTHAQAETTEIDNVDRVAKIWRELSEDLRKELSAKIEYLKEENSKNIEEWNTAIEQNKEIMLENKIIKEQNESIKVQMSSLEKQLNASALQIKTLTDQNKSLLQELRKSNKNYAEETA